MYKAQVLTRWTSERTPDLHRFLQAGDSAMDVTGQAAENITPDPNLCVWELWCSADTLAAIEADPDYGAAAILWSEEIADETI